MPEFKIPNRQTYRINKIKEIKTPALVVFKESVLRNLELMKFYLEMVSPNSGYKHLCPHVKTHKSSYIIKMMLDTLINSFKCSPNEVEMLVESGAKEIFVAYPLLEQNANELAEFIIKHPEINFQVQLASIEHAEIFKKVASTKNITWNYFIDIDVGMHRTGTESKNVYDLYQHLSEWENFNFVGLHGYDGHNHHTDNKLRLETSQESMSVLINLYNQFERNDVQIKKIMVAGSPGFQSDLEILYETLKDKVEIIVSPGTWIYWDSKYDNILPRKFEFAAFVLAQVMDIGENQITLNLGHKRWAADQGGIHLFSEPDLKLKSFSEEHTVLTTNKSSQYKIGDYILIVPRHVCPTVNLYENFTLIGNDGVIENPSIPVDARNR
jgi:D-serine deaminase-like pyridoxal phosphate-dependent protein